jgi:hypothetical protein
MLGEVEQDLVAGLHQSGQLTIVKSFTSQGVE